MEAILALEEQVVVATSELLKLGVICTVFASIIAGIALLWNEGDLEVTINPLVEKACFDAVGERAPLGHRALIVFSYKEESSNLGIASGGAEAQYAPNQWTQVLWTCRVNPSNRKIARIEFAPATGGHRLRSAASAF